MPKHLIMLSQQSQYRHALVKVISFIYALNNVLVMK